MRTRDLTSNPTGLLAGALLALSLIAPAHAELEIFGPEQVLERFVHQVGSRTVLAVGGRTWDLVLDPHDSVLSSLGDGRFHPMSREHVEAALREVDVRLSPLEGKILILPWPRRALLKSSHEDGVIFLSPGLRPVHPAHVHATVVHELGHLVQDDVVPESSRRWREYLVLRGIDGNPYRATARHKNRPREIFAEDFRYLLGGVLATVSGAIENENLPLPTDVPGLETWFRRSLTRHTAAGAEAHATVPRSYPNPFRISSEHVLLVRFPTPGEVGSRLGTADFAADVYDVSGRQIRDLKGTHLDAETVVFRWNGRAKGGEKVRSGIYFVRWREHPEAGVARVQVLR